MIQINTNFIPPSPQTFIVGGTVRDLLLGTPPVDYDLVTFENPKSLAARIAENSGGRLVELGKASEKIFRVIAGDRTFDVAAANGGTIEEDLGKRDFTINAMAIAANNGNCVDAGSIIDRHNGRKDLSRRVIRMIAQENLRSDPLRMLRAYRIGAMNQFSVDPDTARAIRTEAFRINTSAGERIRDELIKLFNTRNAYKYIMMMNNTGLLTAVFPELIPLTECSQNTHHKYNVFEHTTKAFDYLEKILHSPEWMGPEIEALTTFFPPASHFALLKWSILLHDIGKPKARSVDPKGRIHFYSHEQLSADMAQQISHRLKLSAHDQRYADFIIRHHVRPLSLFIADRQHRLSRKALTRFFLTCGPWTTDLLIHTAADLYGKGISENTRAFIEFITRTLRLYSDAFLPEKSRPPLINGNDLIHEFGLTPSPLFSKILGRIEEEQFSQTITTRIEAIDLVKKMLDPA